MTTLQIMLLGGALGFILALLDSIYKKLKYLEKMISYLHEKVDKLNHEDEDEEDEED